MNFLKTTPLSTWITIVILIIALATAASGGLYRLNQVEARVDIQQSQIDSVRCDISIIQQDTAVIKSTLVDIKNELVYQREHK
jgi:hypothetical protein